MNAETLKQHRRTIMRTMSELGGSATVQHLTAAAVIPTPLLREVMRTLIADGLVQLVKDNLYVMRPAAAQLRMVNVASGDDIIPVIASSAGEKSLVEIIKGK